MSIQNDFSLFGGSTVGPVDDPPRMKIEKRPPPVPIWLGDDPMKGFTWEDALSGGSGFGGGGWLPPPKDSSSDTHDSSPDSSPLRPRGGRSKWPYFDPIPKPDWKPMDISDFPKHDPYEIHWFETGWDQDTSGGSYGIKWPALKAPPEFNQLIVTCIPNHPPNCCDENMLRDIRSFYDKVFGNAPDSWSNWVKLFPTYLWNCLVDVWNKICIIECRRGSKPSSVAGSVPNAANMLIIDPAEPSWWESAFNSLLVQVVDTCKYPLNVAGICAFAILRGESVDPTLKPCEGLRRRGDYSYSTDRLVLVDPASGRVFTNPFYPDLPPEDWTGNASPNGKARFLFQSNLYKCK